MNIRAVLPIFAIPLLFTACPRPMPDSGFAATLLPSNVIPQLPAAQQVGYGSATATFISRENRFEVVGDYVGLTSPVLAVEVHGPAVSGVNAPTICTVRSVNDYDSSNVFRGSGIISGSCDTKSMSEKYADLYDGKLYIQLQVQDTTKYPNGALRGQLYP
jgi:hypothetical protein